jgi:hypothetical protein
MKYWSALSLALLIGLGLTLVYLEASRIDLPCEQAQYRCEVGCFGDFSIDYCWDSGQHTYCYFWCYWSDHCIYWSENPVHQVCTFN